MQRALVIAVAPHSTRALSAKSCTLWSGRLTLRATHTHISAETVAHETIECDLQNKATPSKHTTSQPGGRAKVPVSRSTVRRSSKVASRSNTSPSAGALLPASAASPSAADGGDPALQNYFAFIKVRRQGSSRRKSEFEEAVAAFETFLEIHQDSEDPSPVACKQAKEAMAPLS